MIPALDINSDYNHSVDLVSNGSNKVIKDLSYVNKINPLEKVVVNTKIDPAVIKEISTQNYNPKILFNDYTGNHLTKKQKKNVYNNEIKNSDAHVINIDNSNKEILDKLGVKKNKQARVDSVEIYNNKFAVKDKGNNVVSSGSLTKKALKYIGNFFVDETYGQQITKIDKDSYGIYDEKSLKKKNVIIINRAIKLHKIDGSYKFEPNRTVLDSMNTEELQRWYDGGLEKEIEKKIKETDMSPVYKHLITEYVKPWLVKEGYVKAPEPEYKPKPEEKAAKETKKAEVDEKKDIPIKLIPSQKETEYDSSNVETWSDKQLKETYRGFDAIVENGVPPATEKEKEMKEKIAYELKNNRNTNPDTLDPLFEQTKMIKLNLEEKIEALRLAKKEIPDQEGELAKELEEAYQFLKSGAGYQISQILARSVIVDDNGNVGFTVKKWIGDINGDNIIDAFDSYENIYAPLLKLINLGKAGKMGEKDPDYKHVVNVTNKYGLPLDELIKGKKIIPTQLQPGDTVFVYSENPDIRKKAAEKGLTKFMDMLGFGIEIAVYARYGRNILGFDEKYDAMKLKIDDSIKTFKKYMVLQEQKEVQLKTDLEEALKKNNLTKAQYDSLEKELNKVTEKSKKDALERKEHFDNLEKKLRDDTAEEKKKAIKAVNDAKEDVNKYKSNIDSLTAEINRLKGESEVDSTQIAYLESQLGKILIKYDKADSTANYWENKAGLLDEKIFNLKTAKAKSDSTARAEEEKRKIAEEKAEDLENKLKRKWSGGFYVNRLHNGVPLTNHGFYFGIPEIGYLRFGFSTKSEETSIKPIYDPMSDPLRPQLTGELTTTTTDIKKGHFISLGLGKDYNKKILSDKDILSIFADLGWFWSELDGTVEEKLQWKNKNGIIIAQDIDINENPGAYDVKDWMLDFGIMYIPGFAQRIKIPIPFTNKRLPAFDTGITGTILLSKDQYKGLGLTFRP